MERRELFSSLASSIKNASKKKPERLVRPPYNNDESLFHNECSKCDAKCATVCEVEIIKIAEDKTPYLDFSKNGCTYCDDCAEACEFGVLTLENQRHIDAKIVINKDECVSWEGVMCFSCKDPCIDNAIDFKAMFMPEINDNCTSCGFCISRCPVEAIKVEIVS